MTNHRSGAVTFKGNPLTLVGDELAPGAKAPNFDLHCYGPDGMQHVKRDDFSGKPLIVSVVPSLDTPVCQVQTKTFMINPYPYLEVSFPSVMSMRRPT